MTVSVHIPLAGPPSIPAELFHAHQRGEMSNRQNHVGQAIWAAENTYKYPIPDYMALPTMLASYVSNRLSGRMSYDTEYSRPLGRWVWGQRELVLTAQADVECLTQLAEWLDAEKLANHALKIRSRVELISNARPPKELADGEHVLKLDADARAMTRSA